VRGASKMERAAMGRRARAAERSARRSGPGRALSIVVCLISLSGGDGIRVLCKGPLIRVCAQRLGPLETCQQRPVSASVRESSIVVCLISLSGGDGIRVLC